MPDRFREVRRALGLTQQELADKLLLSRNYIAKIESGVQEPAARVLRDLESLRVDSGNLSSTSPEAKADYRKSGSLGDSPMGKAGERSPPMMLDPRFQPRAEPTPKMCLEYFQEFLARAEHEPGGVGFTWRLLHKHFPLDEFEPKSKAPS